MKAIAVILADLQHSPLGTRSRLCDALAGVPVLRRTVMRALEVKGVDSVHVLARAAELTRVRDLLAGLPAIVNEADVVEPPHAELVRTARKWALDNWRGGIAGSCSFDESFHAAALQAVAHAAGADAVMAVPAHAALLSPSLATAMLEHLCGPGKDFRFVFSQSPPGLTPILLTAEILAELASAAYPPGVLLAFKPSAAEPDLVAKPCCYQVPTAVVTAWGRLLADTDGSFTSCQAALQDLGEDRAADPIEVCRFLGRHRQQHLPPLPCELEIELTTSAPLPATRLRPAGPAVPLRGPLDAGLLEKVLTQIAARDDSLVVFGGFGDPLCEPPWLQAIRLARQAGIFGVSVHTTGKQLAHIDHDALLADPPDLLVVRIDAATEDVYAAVHGEPGLDETARAVQALEETRRQRKQVRPLIVPAMTKSILNVTDQEEFFEQWLTRIGSCWIEGYSDRAGQMERLQVASMAPPARVPCRRLRSRLVMLADGCAVACDQDFRAVHAVGDLNRQTLQEAWQSEAMQQLRNHLPGKSSGPAILCDHCEEWSRP
jgi:hypothetical protein